MKPIIEIIQEASTAQAFSLQDLYEILRYKLKARDKFYLRFTDFEEIHLVLHNAINYAYLYHPGIQVIDIERKFTQEEFITPKQLRDTWYIVMPTAKTIERDTNTTPDIAALQDVLEVAFYKNGQVCGTVQIHFITNLKQPPIIGYQYKEGIIMPVQEKNDNALPTKKHFESILYHYKRDDQFIPWPSIEKHMLLYYPARDLRVDVNDNILSYSFLAENYNNNNRISFFATPLINTIPFTKEANIYKASLMPFQALTPTATDKVIFSIVTPISPSWHIYIDGAPLKEYRSHILTRNQVGYEYFYALTPEALTRAKSIEITYPSAQKLAVNVYYLQAIKVENQEYSLLKHGALLFTP